MWQQPFTHPAISLELAPAQTDHDNTANNNNGPPTQTGKQQHVQANVEIENLSEYAANIAHTGEHYSRGRVLFNKLVSTTNLGRTIYAAGISIKLDARDKRYLLKANAAGQLALSGYVPALEIGIRFEGPNDESNRNLAGRVVTAGQLELHRSQIVSSHFRSPANSLGFLFPPEQLHACEFIHDRGRYAANASGSHNLASDARAYQRPTEIVLLLVLKSAPLLYRQGTSADQNARNANIAEYTNEAAHGFVDLTLQRIKDPGNDTIARRF